MTTIFVLPQVVERLREALRRQDRTAPVEVLETHRSFVLLTQRYAYKLKKPMRTAFLDFASLEARELACKEELRLNRRLAPDVYLRAVPVARTSSGELQVGVAGEVVEWLVKMRRLPADQMLDQRLRQGSVGELESRRVADVLVGFYAEAEAAPMTPAAYLARFRRDIESDRKELAAQGGYGPLADELARGLLSALALYGDYLAPRGRSVTEVHGDLRPEHVCLEVRPVIIDCLDFCREFRLLDPVDELAYLGLECEKLGSSEFCRRLLELYAQATGDLPAPPVLEFYRAYRAFLRAKLAVWRAREVGPRAGAWAERARDYLDLCQRHMPMLKE